jgi:E3 SUMO-protein ligase PIAS1
MASLQQQKGSLETRIKLLVNVDLKDICRHYNYQVSGTKAVLQKRVIEGEEQSMRHVTQFSSPPSEWMCRKGQTTTNGNIFVVLDDIVAAGDEDGFKKLNHMVANHGQVPRLSLTNTAGASNNNNNIHNNNTSTSQMVNGGAYAQYGNGGFARPQQHVPRAKCESS